MKDINFKYVRALAAHQIISYTSKWYGGTVAGWFQISLQRRKMDMDFMWGGSTVVHVDQIDGERLWEDAMEELKRTIGKDKLQELMSEKKRAPIYMRCKTDTTDNMKDLMRVESVIIGRFMIFTDLEPMAYYIDKYADIIGEKETALFIANYPR